MSLIYRKRLLQAKTETTYGTDATPTGSDAILVRNLEITPLMADLKSRDLVRPYLGNFDNLLAQTRVECKFEVELAGSGTAGTAPKYGPILKACGLSETVVATTSVTYAPVSSSFSSATIYYNVDGLLHRLTGCRGTFEIKGQVGEIPTLAFTMTGVYNAPTDTAQATATYSNQATPLIFKQGNTSGFSALSYSGVLQSITMNLAGDIQYRELVGGNKEALFVDRKPAGNFVIEAPYMASKDYFTAAVNTTQGTMAFTHGVTAGNIFAFSAAQVSLQNPSYSELNGITMLTVPFIAAPTSAGNNEFTLAYT